MEKLLILLCIASIMVSACGGGGGGGAGGAATTNTLSGLAATGAAINGTVCLRDAASHEVCTTTTDGHYSFDVSSLTPPFVLKASWSDNGTPKELYSIATAKGVANISPLTHAITSEASGTSPAALYISSNSNVQAAAENTSSAITNITRRYN